MSYTKERKRNDEKTKEYIKDGFHESIFSNFNIFFAYFLCSPK